MAKFISVPLAAVINSGTTTETIADKLVQSGQDFLSTVRVGDIIVNNTNETTAVVTEVDSDTILSVSPDLFLVDEDFTIYSSTITVDQIINATGALLVVQAGIDEVKITYLGQEWKGWISISHTPLVSGSVDFRTAVQNAIIESLSAKNNLKSVFPIVLPDASAVLLVEAIG